MTQEWQPMETAPKDGTPILAWCAHEADPYYLDDGSNNLTAYGACCEAYSHVPDGYALVEWGGGFSEWDEYHGRTYNFPDWWFQLNTDFEVAANPIAWMPLPEKLL